MHAIVRSFILFSVVIVSAVEAHADDVGEFGTPVALEIRTASADSFLTFHGRLLVKDASGELDEYRWGGTSCGLRLLTDAQVAALQAGLDNKKMRIQPITQIGQGDMVCLVGFNLVPKQNLKLLP